MAETLLSVMDMMMWGSTLMVNASSPTVSGVSAVSPLSLRKRTASWAALAASAAVRLVLPVHSRSL